MPIHIHHGSVHVHVYDAFEESEHPRAPDGQFAASGTSSAGKNKPLSTAEKARAHAALAALEEQDHPWAESGETPEKVVHPSAVGFNRPDIMRLGGQFGDPKKGIVRAVPINKINYSQPYVPKEGIKAYIENINSNPELPDLGHIQGTNEHFVIGGHTRLSAQALAGREAISARVHELAPKVGGGYKRVVKQKR